MEELNNRIRSKVEELLHAKVDQIEKVNIVSDNTVYKVFVKNKPYIFKIYRQRTWPEDGKLIFINNKLMEHNIGCAKIITFDRNDSYFQTGFLLEECLPGENADRFDSDSKWRTKFYIKFAQLVSKVHRIPIENYGYIGSGIADHTSFIDSINDKYDEIANDLINKKLFDPNRLQEIKKPVIDRLRLCESLPSVLNHGDLSTRNVMIDKQGELTLIDWDDAMSYNWIADLARMTYWMRFKYKDYEYELYRHTFMEHYSTESDKGDFAAFENAFHVLIGLDVLNYYAHAPQYEATMTYFKKTIEKLHLK